MNGMLLAATMFAIPLLILLWFLRKITNAHLHKMKLLKEKTPERRKAIFNLCILLSTIAFIFILFTILIFIGIAPEYSSSIIPLPLKIIIFIILSVIYGVFISIFAGLGDVVGAAGSATKVMEVLNNYLKDYFNINSKEESNLNKEKELNDSKKNVATKI